MTDERTIHWLSIAAFSAVAVVTIAIGVYATRVVRTTSDFFVASRSVGPLLNASAISGEYLSAASFMGAAALVMHFGYDVLWFPAGYAAGYLLLLVFVAAPLRRFGAYTIPDFAEGRFDSPLFRRVAVVFVLVIGVLYMLPQMKGAGITVQTIAGGQVPYWLGVVLVGGIITLNVAIGGMKGITLVQAFQYWVKVFALALPTFVLLGAYGGYAEQFSEAARTRLPGVDPESSWATPFGSSTEDQRGHALLFTYSLMAATICGTAGLPHILLRFYTNRTGQAARQTTLVVLALIGTFYLFPSILGVVGRAQLAPDATPRQMDTLVLELPGLLGGPLGEVLRAVVAAGAFAAFMSTTSGLLVAVSGALAHDIYARTLRPLAGPAARLLAFRISALGAGLVAIFLGLQVERFSIAVLVGWAFAIAASSFFPLLTLGIWWRGLTLPGAIAGTCLGGASASLSILATMLTTSADGGLYPPSYALILLAQPAIWTIPVAFGTMVVVSRLTTRQVPGDVSLKMLRLHVPEGLGLRTAGYVVD